VVTTAGNGGDEYSGQWSKERAWAWYKSQPWFCGFNYVPANSISYTEMWMDYAFDENLIDEELGLAAETGFSVLRVVLPFVVWEAEPEAFLRRFDAFLSICDAHQILVMPCFFDDCVFGPISDPEFGVQPGVVDGWYANGWTPSPGHARVRDVRVRPKLEQYVKAVMAAHRSDARIVCWDLYNEPGNNGLGNDSLSLLADVFRWAREIGPIHPITSGHWGVDSACNDFVLAASDVITFHNYDPAGALRAHIARLEVFDRPLICSEWLNRPRGSVVADCLPVFFEKRIGALHWGLVNGKTQTHLPWGHRPGDPEPTIWQHDLYHAKASERFEIYDPGEIEMFQQMLWHAGQVHAED
jgi:hypothetical protein